MKLFYHSDGLSAAGGAKTPQAGAMSSCHSSRVSRHGERGIALVITLIMLAITLVMAVAFLALARRERSSVATSTDTATARLAADAALASAQAQIVANILNGFTNGVSGNAYNLRLFVSTNYINSAGFNQNVTIFNPTNVNYFYRTDNNLLTVADRQQNIANLWFLPRAPVFFFTNTANPGYDFRYYLDLNQNSRFEQYGYVPEITQNGLYLHPDLTEDNNTANVVTNFAPGGDPEWVGILQRPDAPHSANNQFISRYAFIAVPAGNTLDVNYIHNQALTKTVNGSPNGVAADGYFRNQSVGSWELNFAAFLADLNTNVWDHVASPYFYGRVLPTPFPNTGFAFDDARSLLSYRYDFNYGNLASANMVLGNWIFPPPTTPPNIFPFDALDAYSDGPLQTNLNTNADFTISASDGDLHPNFSWVGADNPNHFFTLNEFFDSAKLSGGFINRLNATGTNVATYNKYTYYRMLDQLGSDSSPDDGKLNLNYDNVVIATTNNSGVVLPYSISVAVGAETNLIPWSPQRFFLAAADKMLRAYSENWFKSDPTNYLLNYYGYLPRGYVDATGLGVTNFPNYGMTNEIPTFGITNIPVLVNGNFVYSPSINRILQLAANLYDATTMINSNIPGTPRNLPHVFRPIFEHDLVGNVFVVSYDEVVYVTGTADPQLAAPHPVSDLPFFGSAYTPIRDGTGLVNVYGVPWVLGAKKGLPNFNQFHMVNALQVTRKMEVTRNVADAYSAVYTTNQMYVIGLSNNLGVTFWNSYAADYPRPLVVAASDYIYETLTNGVYRWSLSTNFSASYTVNAWTGARWTGATPDLATPNANSFLSYKWQFLFQTPLTYDYANATFDVTGQWKTTAPPLPNLPQFGLLITNYLQAVILDGGPGNYNVIDYVQLRDPISVGGVNQGLADPDYVQANNIFYQWSTNLNNTATPWGPLNQLWVSGHPPDAPKAGGRWSTDPTPMGETTPEAEAAFYNGFFVPSFQYKGQNYVNNQLSIQAPYTPFRTVFSSFLLQANDPLVHYLSSDLNAQYGALAIWSGKQSWKNGIFFHVDDVGSQPTPVSPATPIGGRYQPWLRKGQMDALAGADIVAITNNYACKDPMVYGSDYWDFMTNVYPSVGWIGRVHRGTPWQTVFMKDADLTKSFVPIGQQTNYIGTNTWAVWTGDIKQDFGQYFDAANYAPVQDRLLFDVFTTRLNDNAVRGALPVNQTHLAAWSAVFSGMMALSNSAPFAYSTIPLTYINRLIDPAGPMNPNLVSQLQPPVWQIVNDPLYGINATRANTNIFPHQAFEHAGDILATPALSARSPFLNRGSTTPGYQQMNFGINDGLYEWLPQHLMGLVRGTEPRFVLYCYGQTLHPAPGGTVLSGNYFQLVTNYQVSAESAIRAVIRIEDANTSKPRVVVESYNVLPPY